MRAEITLNGLQLSVLDSEKLHVPERFTVLGVAKILHKSILRASGDSLQVKMSNEIDLCFPASRFESALADVVVAGRACKGEVIGEQAQPAQLTIELRCRRCGKEATPKLFLLWVTIQTVSHSGLTIKAKP